MKSVTFLLAVSCLIPLATAPLAAQTFSLKADIPFAFMVDGKTMPAGEYAVDSGMVSQTAVQLRNLEIGGGVLAATVQAGGGPAWTNTQARLIFHRYGNRYFLYQVWEKGEDAGRTLPPSRQERTIAKEMASVRPDTTMILAKR
jgi:hypothetical protein